MENKDIYLSLDEARIELRKRWNDTNLRSVIEKELGKLFMPQFLQKPRGVLFRQICPADNGFEFFYYNSKYIGAEPLVLEYYDDIFVHFNEEKKGLGRLRVVLEDESKAMVDIMNFHENEKRKLGECILKNGEKLVDFHHSLFDALGHRVETIDNTKWFHLIGMAKDYYYYLLLHCVAHGVLFEVFQDDDEDESEDKFNKQIIFPTIERIQNKLGLRPIVVRLYPDDQSAEDDFFWWRYPSRVNDNIVDYAAKNKFLIKTINF